MSDPVANSTATVNPQAPPGRCGKCGYLVHPGAGFVCSECGADLRRVGIVTGHRRRNFKPILWFALFAIPWTVLCLLGATLVSNSVFDDLRSFRLTYRGTYRLVPLDGHYESIVIVREIQGTFKGMRTRDEALKDLNADLKYEVTATLNSSQGATVLHVNPLADMAWRRVGGAGDDKDGKSALNKAALLEWLHGGAPDASPVWSQHEADELMFIFDRVKLEVDGGHSFADIAGERGIPAAVAGWRGTPAFDGFEISNYQSPPPAPVSQELVTFCVIAVWGSGIYVWFWRQRSRRKVSAGAADATSPATPASTATAMSHDAAESAEPSHRLLSILFSDVKDYTSRSAAQPRSGVLDIVRRHREQVFPVVTRHRGRVVKQMGDGILCAFDSATDAVLAGLEIQGATSAARDADPLELRIAICTGEVTLEANDVFGPTVNLASRVQQLAGAGEVFFNETTFSLLNDKEVRGSEVGVFELKGVAQPVKVYRAVGV
jgi:class 3 adenylate cyclase